MQSFLSARFFSAFLSFFTRLTANGEVGAKSFFSIFSIESGLNYDLPLGLDPLFQRAAIISPKVLRTLDSKKFFVVSLTADPKRLFLVVDENETRF